MAHFRWLTEKSPAWRFLLLLACGFDGYGLIQAANSGNTHSGGLFLLGAGLLICGLLQPAARKISWGAAWVWATVAGAYTVMSVLARPFDPRLPDLQGQSMAMLLNLALLWVVALFFLSNPKLHLAGMLGAVVVSGLEIYLLASAFPPWLHPLWLGFLLLAALLVAGGLAVKHRAQAAPDSNQEPGWALSWFFFAALLLFGLVVIMKCAWVCDDAFITFRTVDNFIHGFGLRWNTVERVQTYTHPLWLFLLSAAVWVSREYYFTAISLGIALTVATLALVVFRGVKTPMAALMAVVVMVFSKAFVDFATSGLENSLAYFLVTIFYLAYLQEKWDGKKYLAVNLVAALIFLSRPDLAILVAPALVYASWQVKKKSGFRPVVMGILGLSPVLLWEAFSLIYYGFLLPNTFYAKLATGVPQQVLLQAGMHYFVNSFNWDPITLIVILLSLPLPWLLHKHSQVPLVLGIVGYLAYIVSVGGCFMSGRFFAVPFVCSWLLLLQAVKFDARTSGLLLAALALLSLDLRVHPWRTESRYENPYLDQSIADERGFYNRVTGLLNMTPAGLFPPGTSPFLHWRTLGLEAREQGKPMLVHGAMGIMGFSAGPRVYVVDELAICNAFLARLPTLRADVFFRIGHYWRKLPAGFLESESQGRNCFLNSRLGQYHQALQEIIRGDLFSGHRLQTIIKMNAGAYAHLINRKYYSIPRPHHYYLSAPPNEADEYLQLMSRALRDKLDYAAMEHYLEEARSRNPNRPEAIIGLGIMFEDLGEMDKALMYFGLLTELPDGKNFFYARELQEDLEMEKGRE